jgi:hypothetical protein
MTSIKLDTQNDKYLISIDKSAFDKAWIVRFLENLRMEELAHQLNFGDEIEEIGDEIKANWWAKNKHRFIHE